MSTWKPQLGRVILFPSLAGGQPRAASDLYKSIWKAEPDSYQKTPAGVQAFAPSVAQGNYKGLSASCSVHPMRIDFALAPLQTEMFTDSLLMIEDGRSFHGELLQLCNAIAEISLNVAVNRVACVVQFGSEAPDLETANKLIMSALPNRYRIALSNEADFILQINHLQTSGIVDKLQLNLINKWAVERARIITMGTSIGQPAIKELLVATVLFDHNNNPESGVLTADEQSRLLVEAFQSMSNSLRDCNLIIEGF